MLRLFLFITILSSSTCKSTSEAVELNKIMILDEINTEYDISLNNSIQKNHLEISIIEVINPQDQDLYFDISHKTIKSKSIIGGFSLYPKNSPFDYLIELADIKHIDRENSKITISLRDKFEQNTSIRFRCRFK